MFNFNREKVNSNERLGIGSSGEIYPYQKSPQDKKWVVKNISTKMPEEVIQSVQEIALGFSCDHPFVLPVKGFFITNKDRAWDIYIKLPRMTNSLRDILSEAEKKKQLIPEEKIAQYFYEIIQGLQYLHAKGIAHRDIKPDNILIDAAGAVKIADFGLGVFQTSQSYVNAKSAGSLLYAAPENRQASELKGKDLFSADLWSLGILLYELCNPGRVRDLKMSLREDEFRVDLMKNLEKIEGRYSNTLSQIILSLLYHRPLERKSLRYIKEDLVSVYGDILVTIEKKVTRQSKGVQTKSNVTEIENIEKLKQEIEIRDTKLREMEKHYKGIVAGLESNLSEIKNTKKLKKEIEIRDAKLLDMEKRYKTIIAGLESKLADTRARESIEKLKEEIRTKDARQLDMENRYKVIIAGFEAKVIELGVDLELERNARRKDAEEWAKRMNKNGNQAENWNLQEFKRRWESYFTIQCIKEFGANKRIQKTISIEVKRDFAIQNQVDDSIVATLMRDLCKIQKRNNDRDLEYFNLDLNGCQKISNQSLQDLMVDICLTFRDIRHLALSFAGCSRIADQGLLSLSAQLGKHLKHLETLKLDFDRCPRISNAGLNELAFRIGSNPQRFRSVNLVFNSQGITDSGVRRLCTSMTENLRELDTIEMLFKNCACTQKGMDSVRNLLYRIPRVKISLKKI